MNEEILKLCVLYFYREEYYKLEEKLSNKYWYSEFDSSKSNLYKYHTEQKFNKCKKEIEIKQRHLQNFIDEFCYINKIDKTDLFIISSIGKVKPAKVNMRIDINNLIKNNRKIYIDIFDEYIKFKNKIFQKELEKENDFFNNFEKYIFSRE